MAVTKLWVVRNNLGRVLNYADNPNKTRNPKFSEQQYQALSDVLAYAKHGIKTDEQLFEYKASVEKEIKTLTADRTHLRKITRRKIDDANSFLNRVEFYIKLCYYTVGLLLHFEIFISQVLICV